MVDEVKTPETGLVRAKKPELLAFAEARSAEITEALAKRVDPDMFLSVLANSMRKNPKLLECTKQSFYLALMETAGLGLVPGLGQAALVPFYDSKSRKTNATLIVMYQGFIELFHRSGFIDGVEAEVVREGDEFECVLGLERTLRHVRNAPFRKGENVIGAYAVITMKTGYRQFEYMPLDELDMIKNRSRGFQSGKSPWQTDLEEMHKKTPLRRLAKWVPKSKDISRALEVDEVPDIENTGAVDVDWVEADPEEKAADEDIESQIDEQGQPGGSEQSPEGKEWNG